MLVSVPVRVLASPVVVAHLCCLPVAGVAPWPCSALFRALPASTYSLNGRLALAWVALSTLTIVPVESLRMLPPSALKMTCHWEPSLPVADLGPLTLVRVPVRVLASPVVGAQLSCRPQPLR